MELFVRVDVVHTPSEIIYVQPIEAGNESTTIAAPAGMTVTSFGGETPLQDAKDHFTALGYNIDMLNDVESIYAASRAQRAEGLSDG